MTAQRLHNKTENTLNPCATQKMSNHYDNVDGTVTVPGRPGSPLVRCPEKCIINTCRDGCSWCVCAEVGEETLCLPRDALTYHACCSLLLQPLPRASSPLCFVRLWQWPLFAILTAFIVAALTPRSTPQRTTHMISVMHHA